MGERQSICIEANILTQWHLLEDRFLAPNSCFAEQHIIYSGMTRHPPKKKHLGSFWPFPDSLTLEQMSCGSKNRKRHHLRCLCERHTMQRCQGKKDYKCHVGKSTRLCHTSAIPSFQKASCLSLAEVIPKKRANSGTRKIVIHCFLLLMLWLVVLPCTLYALGILFMGVYGNKCINASGGADCVNKRMVVEPYKYLNKIKM